MKGLLFYDKTGAERNEWFIARLTQAAAKRGCELKLVIAPDDVEDALTSDFDFAIVRTICPSLNERLENLNIPTFNNAKTSYIANDKWQTYLFAKSLDMCVMDTVLIDDAVKNTPLLPYPCVIKSRDGHGGTEVFKVENLNEQLAVIGGLFEKSLIAQSMCSEPGIDMRVYALGGKILAAAKRSSRSDFRSNFSLGGSAEIVIPNDTVLAIVKLVTRELDCDLVGIDFIRHNGEWVLNEIEDVVGTRMLYSLTDIDAADMYIEYIINKLHH